MGRRRHTAPSQGFEPRSVVAQVRHDARRPRDDPASYVVSLQGHNEYPTGRLVNVGAYNGVTDYRGSFADYEAAKDAVRAYLANTTLTLSKAGRVIHKRKA